MEWMAKMKWIDCVQGMLEKHGVHLSRKDTKYRGKHTKSWQRICTSFHFLNHQMPRATKALGDTSSSRCHPSLCPTSFSKLVFALQIRNESYKKWIQRGGSCISVSFTWWDTCPNNIRFHIAGEHHGACYPSNIMIALPLSLTTLRAIIPS